MLLLDTQVFNSIFYTFFLLHFLSIYCHGSRIWDCDFCVLWAAVFCYVLLTGLYRTGLYRTGLYLTGLYRTGLYRTGLYRTGLYRTGLYRTAIH